MKYKQDLPITMDIKELPLDQRPRERMEKHGPTALSDLELLTIMIGSGSKERPVQMLAQDLLSHLDMGTAPFGLEQISEVRGMGPAKSSLICAALEFGRRRLPSKRRQITSPGDVFPLIQHYGTRQQEHFLSISLNGAHEIMGITVVSIGLVNRTLVHPREVFAEAVKERATAVIIAHNHPSGNLNPSDEDRDVTKRLKQAGDILGIKILDHLVFDQDTYVSLLEQGEF